MRSESFAFLLQLPASWPTSKLAGVLFGLGSAADDSALLVAGKIGLIKRFLVELSTAHLIQILGTGLEATLSVFKI